MIKIRGIPIRRGDIILVLFPQADLVTVKKRPALVVQADYLNTGIPQILIAQITSNMDRGRLPCGVTIPEKGPLARGTGLRTQSVIATDQLTTVEQKIIFEKIGRFSTMTLVDDALRYTLALGSSSS